MGSRGDVGALLGALVITRRYCEEGHELRASTASASAHCRACGCFRLLMPVGGDALAHALRALATRLEVRDMPTYERHAVQAGTDARSVALFTEMVHRLRTRARELRRLADEVEAAARKSA